MKVGVIGAGTMGQGIAKAFAQVDGYEVALCDIKQEWAEGGKEKVRGELLYPVQQHRPVFREAVSGALRRRVRGAEPAGKAFDDAGNGRRVRPSLHADVPSVL